MVISFQLANDHYRPAHYLEGYGYDRKYQKRKDEAFTTLKDYYTMLKLGYRF